MIHWAEGLSPAEFAEQLRLFARDVMPAFARHCTPPASQVGVKQQEWRAQRWFVPFNRCYAPASPRSGKRFRRARCVCAAALAAAAASNEPGHSKRR